MKQLNETCSRSNEISLRQDSLKNNRNAFRQYNTYLDAYEVFCTEHAVKKHLTSLKFLHIGTPPKIISKDKFLKCRTAHLIYRCASAYQTISEFELACTLNIVDNWGKSNLKEISDYHDECAIFRGWATASLYEFASDLQKIKKNMLPGESFIDRFYPVFLKLFRQGEVGIGTLVIVQSLTKFIRPPMFDQTFRDFGFYPHKLNRLRDMIEPNELHKKVIIGVFEEED